MCLFNFKKRKKMKVTVKMEFDNNCSDEIEQESALPVGWIVYNKNYVDMIDADIQPFRERIFNAKTIGVDTIVTASVSEYVALKSVAEDMTVLSLEDLILEA